MSVTEFLNGQFEIVKGTVIEGVSILDSSTQIFLVRSGTPSSSTLKKRSTDLTPETVRIRPTEKRTPAQVQNVCGGDNISVAIAVCVDSSDKDDVSRIAEFWLDACLAKVSICSKAIGRVLESLSKLIARVVVEVGFAFVRVDDCVGD